jgi:hypothetical protein
MTHYYTFDNANGNDTITNDGTYNLENFNGSHFNDTVRIGSLGYSYYCDGLTGYLKTTNTNSFMNIGTNDFTIEGWFYLVDAQIGNVLFSDYDTGMDNGIRFTIENVGFILYIQLLQGNAGSSYGSNNHTIPTGQFVHYAFVRNATAELLYINGVLDNVHDIASVNINDSVYPFTLCNEAVGTNHYTETYGDELMIFNSTRTDAEVLIDMLGYEPPCTLNSDCNLCEKCDNGTCISQNASEDLKSDCAESPSCLNNYTIQHYNGLCDGLGACNTTTINEFVAVGNVCLDSLNVNPNATLYCGIGTDCIQYSLSASEFYLGYDNSGLCVDTDWQSKGTNWTAPTGFNISLTEHNLSDECAVHNYTIPCFTNWTCIGYGACNTTNLRPCNLTEDLNNCGVPYGGDYMEFTPLSCNYCSPTWDASTGKCVAGGRTVSYYYTNSCCNLTGLPSDCNKPANSTISCFDYGESGDVGKVTSDSIVKLLASFSTLATFIGLGVLTIVAIRLSKKK